MPNEAKELIRACLEIDPNSRPTIEQVLQHPFLNSE